MSDSEPEIEKTLSDLRLLKSLIDTIEEHLKGLRTICVPNDEYTQKEIRVAEGKLVKYYSKQIIVKNKLSSENVPEVLEEFPNTRQFLSVVGIPEETIQAIFAKEENVNLYTLLEKSEADIKTLLLKYNASNEDARRLNLALRNLKICTERELSGASSTSGDSDVELHWTSSQSTSSYGDFPARPSPRPSTSSQSSSDNSTTAGIPTQTHSTPPSPVTPSHNERMRSVGCTPPPTPPTVRTPKTKYPITPPPKKRLHLFPEYPMARSKSQESQLAHKVQDIDPVRTGKRKQANVKDLNLNSNMINLASNHDPLIYRRHSNELDPGGNSRGPSGPASPIITSPMQSPHFMHAQPTDDRLVVPVMKHRINHKFINRILFSSTCDICNKNIFIGKCCRYCKFKCHKDCLNKVPPSCGLTEALLDGVMKVPPQKRYSHSVFDGFRSVFKRKRSISNTRRPTTPNPAHTQHTPETLRSARSVPAFQGPDSSSASSSNSSNSSPVPPGMSSGTITSPSPYPSPRVQQSFQFPDISESSSNITQTEPLVSGFWDRDIDRASTNNSDKTIIGSNASEITLERVDSEDSQDEPPGSSLTRINSLSLALKEWDIPYEELISEEPIGTGRFGTVYKGQWHGDVAIKMLNVDPDTDFAAQLSAFKREVAMLRKTRHENLVLFMGACMKPPHLAIVTSLCRGSSLYTLLHVRKEKFPMSKTIIIAQQVSQGMGYLHAKGIIHKDLKTKNIFFDKDKVVITDFGLFNVTKLCHANRHADRLQIPPGWLCYLSPEITKSLQAGAAYANTDLPFSEMSDVYAFGTVWYELLNGNWPFCEQPPESIIWQVGHGIKPSFGSIRGSKEVKDMLVICWAYNPDDRPSFSQLLKIMERLPRKPFQRSPSHPTHLLSRSADSLHTS